MKGVIVNTDDFAMNDAVDDAIVDLAEQGVVTAASAMVLSPTWNRAGRRLAGLDIDHGLHLDFTSPFVRDHGTAFTLRQLIARAYSGTLSRRVVRDTIQRQIDMFHDVMQAPPHFVDGHQHVHRLPIIADELLAALKDNYGAGVKSMGFRLCGAARWRGAKSTVISALAHPRLHDRVVAAGLRINTDFAGVYGFEPNANLARLWKHWLSSVKGPRPLIMCHPARPGSADASDPIEAARHAEYRFLVSPEFRDLLAALRARTVRWSNP